MSALESASKLKAQFGDLVSGPMEFRAEVTLTIADAERIAEVCGFAKSSMGFDSLIDISSVDNYEQAPRWTIVYELCDGIIDTTNQEVPTVSSRLEYTIQTAR